MKTLFYRVASGDNVLSLSAKFSTSAAIIISENNLTSEPQEGDVLVIEIPEKVYVVQPEDTALSIAEKFGLTEEQLLEKNKIPYVFAGETIII